MPFTAQDLIEGRPAPVCIAADSPVLVALEQMIENDFSQLPIINNDCRPTGLVTSDGILRGLDSFGVGIGNLYASDVSQPAPKFSLDGSIFDLLEIFYSQPAVLIVDNEGRLVNIVTTFDTTDYFRRRAEDMMLVDDIEGSLKDHITAAFSNPETGEPEAAALQAAIDEVSNAQAYASARKAVYRYVQEYVEGHKPKQKWVDEACSHLLREGRKLDDLTLQQFIDLLFHKSRWPDYQATFKIGEPAIRHMLEDIRDIRNALAHFRGEITKSQREKLRRCQWWFEQNPTKEPKSAVFVEQVHGEQVPEDELAPLDEEIGHLESRYAKLALHLQDISRKQDRVELTFAEIEEIIGHELPPSSLHRSWWANDSVSHVQSIQWLDAGWRVAGVNLTARLVRFARSKERELAYISFFSSLLADFREQAEYPVRDTSPIGQNWIAVMGLPRVGNQLAMFAFTFTYSKQFRVELYIDAGDQAKNKHVFDSLCDQRNEIEEEVGSELAWERLNSRRASRIALYTTGNINDSDEDLTHLRGLAVGAMVRFQRAMVDRADELLRMV